MARVHSNGVELEVVIDGDDDGIPLLMIMGLGAQLVSWDEEFFHGFVDRGFRVIRFDNRDIGLSTWFDDVELDIASALLGVLAGEPVDAPYHLGDLAADTAGLLDALGIEQAHVMGASMGGMVAQQLAIDFPAKVRTLTSIMSTTGDPDVGHPDPSLLGLLLTPMPQDREAAIARGVEIGRSIGSPAVFDEDWARARAEREYDRAFHPAGVARQLLGILTSHPRSEALRELTIDTLVIHGDVDPLVHVSGGERTAEVVPGAELLILEGMGDGVKILEIAGIGPGPFAAMLLADMGADVLRVDRAQSVMGGDPANPPADVLNRGRRSVGIDLKHPEGVETLLALVEAADALVEGFRPGVAERLGFGPDVCLDRNPRLVFGRMTGWGQDGPFAQMAGHDINYIALAGALEPIGRAGQPPLPPLNLVGDFGGGGMFLAFGVVCALLDAQRSGRGQVVDAAMVDGAAVLMTMFHAFRAMGMWKDERGTNLLDTGAWFYEVYETADGKYLSVGALEKQFYEQLVTLSGLADEELPWQHDQSTWPAMKERLAAVIRTKTRDEWCAIFDGTDACVAPVLSIAEAPEHPHNAERATFVEHAGIVQPAPAPRFSRTPGAIQRPPAFPGQHTDEALTDWGLAAERVAELRAAGAIA